MPVINGTRFPRGTPERVIAALSWVNPENAFYPCIKRIATHKDAHDAWVILDRLQAKPTEGPNSYSRWMLTLMMQCCFHAKPSIEKHTASLFVTNASQMNKIANLASELLAEFSEGLGGEIQTQCLMVEGGMNEGDEELKQAHQHFLKLLEYLSRGARTAAQNDGRVGGLCAGMPHMGQLNKPNTPARIAALYMKRLLLDQCVITPKDNVWKALEIILTVAFADIYIDAEKKIPMPVPNAGDIKKL